jgi:tetratricopeptide (TPR) repeat protein
LAFLQKQGLEALHRLATGALPYDSFRELALAEQAIRVEAAKVASLAQEAEEQARKAAMQAKMKLFLEQAEAARRARESDPRYIAKIKNRELRDRYGIDTYVEQDCFSWLMDILKRVDASQRLSEEDFVWLSSAGKDYFTEQLQAAYHRLEADFFASEFRKTRDPWAAVNASGHYRKCDRAGDANSLLRTINIEQQKSLKLKSALCTTHGGVMRDLRHWNEALRLGEKAHALSPDDYRPCTLLGAVHMEMGNYNLGHEWYDKAVERGARDDDIDRELRSIFFRAGHAKQKQMRESLLRCRSYPICMGKIEGQGLQRVTATLRVPFPPGCN